jgi:hypothetical protein
MAKSLWSQFAHGVGSIEMYRRETDITKKSGLTV